MENIISPIPAKQIEAELTEDLFLRRTNRASNKIYCFKASQAPQTMREVGRLREEAFRYYGGGSGKEMDLDEYDLDDSYTQMIVWDPEDKMIVGGYRYILGSEAKPLPDGTVGLASNSMFYFSPVFVEQYLPYTIELGRSFVTLEYQVTKLGGKRHRKALFGLDNLWDGLGSLTLVHPEYKYFFGKVTMYKDYHRFSRDIIIYLLMKHYPDPDKLVYPRESIAYETDENVLAQLLPHDNFKEDYKEANRIVHHFGINIPPLVNAYMQLSEDMIVFGPAVNHHFSDVEETAILISFDKIEEKKKRRHVATFLQDCAQALRRKLLLREKKKNKNDASLKNNKSTQTPL